MKPIVRVISSGLLVAAMSIGAATASAADAPAPAKVTYDDNIQPLLRNRCLNCHNPDQHKAGLDLSTYKSAMAGNEDGPVIQPGSLDDSTMFKVVSHAQEPFMPPKSAKLPDAELTLIRNWIVGGALENSGSKAAITVKPKASLELAPVDAGAIVKSPMPPALPMQPLVQLHCPGPLPSLAASPGAPLVAVGSQREIFLYNTQTLAMLGVIPFPEGVPTVMKFSRDGRLLIIGGGEAAKLGKVVIWDVASGKRVTEVGDEYDTVLAADISPDHSTIALGGPAKVVKIYSTSDGKLIRTIKKHTDWVAAIAYSPDGVLLASGDRAGGLYVWESKNGEEFYTLTGHKEAITDLCFRRDSNVLASASQDGAIKCWNMKDGTTAFSISAHEKGVLSVAFATDGRLVSAGRDNTAKLWKGDGGALQRFEAFPDIALHAAITSDGNRVVAGDYTGLVKVFEAKDGKLDGALTPAGGNKLEAKK